MTLRVEASTARRVLVPTAIGGPPIGPFGGQALVAMLEGRSMGTTWRVRLATHDRHAMTGHRAAIEGLLAILVDELSNWEPDSALSRFNRAPLDRWQSLPAALAEVLRAAVAVHATSGGAFDPTVAKAVALWGFGPRPASAPLLARRPRPEQVRACLGAGLDAIELDGDRARRRADVTLDLCGIAKGYAVDRLSRLLTERGAPHHLVELGGELRGEGVKPDGMPWWVALETPPDLRDDEPTIAALHGLSIATSGDYRHAIELDGERLAHTIDPRTARPVLDAPAAVTVLHADCMMADAYATAITVLGAAGGLAYASREGLTARIVSRTATPQPEVVDTAAFATMLA